MRNLLTVPSALLRAPRLTLLLAIVVVCLRVDPAQAGEPTPTPTATPSPTPALPDLRFRATGVNPYISIETFPSEPDVPKKYCEVVEGCIQAGTRKVLRFTTETRNVGEGDLDMGSPLGSPLFVYAPCHNHYHFEAFADYRLKDINGVVVTGFKSSFCLWDNSRFDPDANPERRFVSCGATDPQGIQAGWADVYQATLPCQYIDITNVAPGSYTLELEVNPDGIIIESNYGNNIITVDVVIPSPTPTVTPTPTPSPTPTETPTVTPTETPTLTPTATPTPSPIPVNDAALIENIIPSKMAPNQGLYVGITLSNTGNTTWSPEQPNPTALGLWDDPCGMLTDVRFGLPPGDTVSPGQQHSFTVYLRAPATPQECTIQFRMVQEFIEWFGEVCIATITIEIPPNTVRGWERYE